MLDRPVHKLMISILIVLLHLPLIYHARSLYAALPAGQGIGDLPATSVLLLLALFALPYGVLAATGTRWNPERARLNESDT